MDYRYGSHTVFQIEYHFVWVTKYRYKVLEGEIAERVRELVRQTCEAFEIKIVKGVVSKEEYSHLKKNIGEGISGQEGIFVQQSVR
jgi:REP element-mobilizing transposase RayT